MVETRITAEQLFEAYFLPLYPADARADLTQARARDANPAKNPSLYAHLDEAAAIFAARAPALLGSGAALDFTDASVHRLAAALTRPRRDAWMRAGEPGTAANELFNVVTHGAAYVGACIVRSHGGAWQVRRPLWESLVELESRAGVAHLAVFHWWLKSLADAGADEAAGPVEREPGLARVTLADRYRTHVEVPTARPDALPVVFAAERPLPRLVRPSYHAFYKYLRAHVPELRDVGEHFPSPERFDAYGFRWMGFERLGGGRMVLAHGQGESGVSLFWMSGAGFEKSAFYPADAGVDHAMQVDGDKIRLRFSLQGREALEEMLWWGP